MTAITAKSSYPNSHCLLTSKTNQYFKRYKEKFKLALEDVPVKYSSFTRREKQIFTKVFLNKGEKVKSCHRYFGESPKGVSDILPG